jgi:hypothetical protein
LTPARGFATSRAVFDAALRQWLSSDRPGPSADAVKPVAFHDRPVTLKTVIESFREQKFKGNRAAKPPDLLLSQDYGDSYLLIEFKRPSHPITRDDIAQAEKYRDDLSPRLSSRQSSTSC